MIFALPFMTVIVYHGWSFFWTSWMQNERSENAIGLDARWFIKGVFYVGLLLVWLGVVSVLMRLVAYLFGGVAREQSRIEIGHSELEA